MGNGESNLTAKGIEELQLNTSFAEAELKMLATGFSKLDANNDGQISTDEFLAIPELQMNPLVMRVIALFDQDKDGEISFEEFIQGLSVFSVRGESDSKLRFAFQVYDKDEDGFISNGELYQVLKQMVGNNLTNVQLQQIVDKTIMEADKDGDGKISFEEFAAAVDGGVGVDLHEHLTVALSEILADN